MNNYQAKVQLTREGYDEFKEELRLIVDKKRPAAVERLSNARSMGDLSENSDYHQAREALEFMDGRMSELEAILQQAQVIKRTSGKKNEVEFGTKVRVKANGDEHTFHIVGEWEADPAEKKISHESPLGQALVGKRVGDKVEVEAPAGKVEYTVLGIE
ncbi:MAG: transcription elongation factor GreA [bacterium]|nr:transcription elongation factor GreA [bacterium]